MNKPVWTPDSWRACPATQIPAYPDAAALAAAERRLAAAPALVTPESCRALLHRIESAARGDGFLLQGGDCAESFGGFSAPRVKATVDTLRALATRLGGDVTITARLAGQFAKPRSRDTETRGGLTLPVYRGDSINDYAFTAHARIADPARMVQAYEQSAMTIAHIPDGVYTCHEALLLPYEEPLTRRDPETGAWYGTSAHFLWLGARTQQLDGAHVEFLRGVANPIGVKCAPWTDADTLLRLLDVLDPDHIAGRLTLIPRMGAAAIDDCLPPLIDAVKRSGRIVTWCCDPMHGNTILTASGTKTRRVEDIGAELTRYFAIHRTAGTHPGGMHLELTGMDVTECTGGISRISDSDLSARYETRCDPRLNPAQAAELAAMVAALALISPAAA